MRNFYGQNEFYKKIRRKFIYLFKNKFLISIKCNSSNKENWKFF